MDINGLHICSPHNAGVLQYSRSCLSVPWWCPSQDSKSVVGEADEEDDIFVILITTQAAEEILWQRTSQKGLLWLSPSSQDQGTLRFSYRLLDQIIHCSASSKRPKTTGLNKKKTYSFTPAALTCSLVLPFKSFQVAQRLHRTVIPQLNKLHEDLVRYPHVAKQADAVKSSAYLQNAGVAVWPTEQGVLLSMLSGNRILQGLMRVNVDKGRLELCLISHGVVGIRVAWVDTLVHAFQAFRQFAQGKTDLQAASPAHSAFMARPTDMGTSEDILPTVLRRTLRTCREGSVLQKLLRKMTNKAKSFPEVRETWVEYGILKALASLSVSLDPYRHSSHAVVLDSLRVLLLLWFKNHPPYSSALHQFLAGAMTCLTVQQAQLDRSYIPLLNLLLQLTQELPAFAELCAAYGVNDWAERALLELLRTGYEAHTRRIAAHARAEEDMRNDAYSQFPSALLGDDELSSQTWGLRRDLSAASAGSETNLYLLAGQHSDTSNHLDTDRITTTASKRPSIVPRLSLTSLPNHPPAPGSRSSRRMQPTDGMRARLGSEHSPKDFSPHPSAAVREVRRLAASVGENMVAGNFAAFLVAKRNAGGAVTASSSGHLAVEDTPRSPDQPIGEWQQPWVYRTKYLLVSLLISLAPHVPAAACDPDSFLKKHLVSDLLLPFPVRCQLLQTGQQPGQPPLPTSQQKLLLSKLQELEAQLLYAQGQPPALALGKAHLLPLPRDPLLEDVRVVGLKLLSVRRPDERVYSEVCELLDVVKLGFQSCMAPSLITRCMLLGSDVLPRVEHLLRSSGRMVLWRSGPLTLMSSLLRLYSTLLQHACSPNVSLVLVESLSGLLTGTDSASLQQEFASCLSTPSHLQQLLTPSQLQSLLVEVWQYFTHVMRLAHRQVTPNDSTHDATAPVLPMSTRSDTLTGLSMEETGVVPPPGSWMTSGTPNVSGGSSARRTSQTGTSFTGGANLLAGNVVNSMRSSPWEGLSVLLSPWLPLLEPNHGLASRQLHTLISPSHSDLVNSSIEVNAAVLDFVEAAFSIPNSPFLDDRRITDHHINFHFLQFARNYQSLPLRPRRTALQACIKHLKVLCALARHPSEPIRRRFYQLRILDFLLRELSLEAQLMSPLMPDSRPYASPTSLTYPDEAIRACTNAPAQQPPPQPDPLDCSPSQTLSPSMGAWASASLSSSSVTLTSPAPSLGFGSGAYGSGVITIDPTATTPIHQTFKISPLSQLVDPLSCKSVTSLPLSAYMNPANSVQSTAHSSSPLMTVPPTPQYTRPHHLPTNVSFSTPGSAALTPPIPSLSPTVQSSLNNPFRQEASTPSRPLIPALNLHRVDSQPSITQVHSPVPPLMFPRSASVNLYQTPPHMPNPADFPAGPSRYSEPQSPASPPEASSHKPQDYMTPDGKFKLGLDLDEDLDRLLELEAMGINAVLDGLSSVGSRSNAGSPRDSVQDSTDSYPYSSLPTSPVKRPSIIPPLSISSTAFRTPPGPVAECTSTPDSATIADFLKNGTPFRMGPYPDSNTQPTSNHTPFMMGLYPDSDTHFNTQPPYSRLFDYDRVSQPDTQSESSRHNLRHTFYCHNALHTPPSHNVAHGISPYTNHPNTWQSQTMANSSTPFMVSAQSAASDVSTSSNFMNNMHTPVCAPRSSHTFFSRPQPVAEGWLNVDDSRVADYLRNATPSSAACVNTPQPTPAGRLNMDRSCVSEYLQQVTSASSHSSSTTAHGTTVNRISAPVAEGQLDMSNTHVAEYLHHVTAASSRSSSTSFNSTTFNGNAFNGNTFNGNTFNGATVNGTTYNGTTVNGTTVNSTTQPVAEGRINMSSTPVAEYLHQVAPSRGSSGPVAEGTSPTDSSPSVELQRTTTPFRIPPLKFAVNLPLNTPPAQASPVPGTTHHSCSPLSATNDPLLPAGSEVSAPLSSTPPSTNPSTSLTADSHPPVVPLLPLSRLSKAASETLDPYGGSKSQRGLPAGGMSASSRAASLGPDAKYEWERQQRGVYMDETLHLLVLQLVLELTFVNNNPDRRFFGLPSSDSTEDYSLQYKNCPLILHHHLSHPSNLSLLPPLQNLVASLGPCQRRLLRLTAPLLKRSMYTSKLLPLARGANAQVYSSTAQVGATTVPVAVKVVDLDNASDDIFHKLYGEVAVMDHLSSCPAALDLLDHGVYGDRFWLVSPLYRCSLRHWRAQQTGTVTSKLRLYLNIFLMVASAVQEVATRGVVHFDIKGENVLLEPLADVSDEEFWNPSGDEPPFRVVLADFGEAQVYLHRDQAFTKESRGTEVFKSPEMLLLGFAHQKREHRNFDRRKHSGAGFPHDVWSLGCLLFELLANRLLFVDGPQSNLTETAGLVSRVCYADPSQPLLTPEESEAVDQLMLAHELLSFILVRDPTRRPTTKHLVQKLQQVLNGPLCDQKLSPHRTSRSFLQGQGSLPPASLMHHHSTHLHSPHSLGAMSSFGLTPPSAMNTPHAHSPTLSSWQLSQHIVLCTLESVHTAEALRQMRVTRAVVLTDAHPENLHSDDWTALNPLLHACAALELPCVTASVHHQHATDQQNKNHYGTLRSPSDPNLTWWDGDQHFSDQHPPAHKLSRSPSKPLSSSLDDALQLVVLIVGQMVRQLGGAHVGNKCLDQLAPVLPYEHAPRLAIIAPAKTLWALGAIAAGYLIHQFHLSTTRALFHLHLLAPQLIPDAEHEPLVTRWLSLLYTECVGPLLHIPGAHHNTPATPVPRFTCLCGTFQAALRTSNQPPPTPRNCSAPLSHSHDCFCDCAGVLESLSRHHGYVTESVQWVTAPTQHVWISPLAPTRVWQGSRDHSVVSPGWRLYTCGVCGCVVCAANSQDASSIQLVANWMEYG